MVRGDDAEGLDHARQGEQAAVARHDLQEIGEETADAGLLADGDDRLQLIFG